MAVSAPLQSLSLVLEGPRVRLRAPSPTDLLALRRLLERNVDHLRPWSPSPPPDIDPLALSSVARSIVRQRREWREGTAYACLMEKRASRGSVIGRVTLSSLLRRSPSSAQLGYWIDEEHAGRGLVSEATGLVVDFAFGALGLDRLQAAVMPANVRSRHVLGKLGFTEEGYAPRYLRIAERWEDHLLFALARERWRTRRAATGPRPEGAVRPD